MKLASLFIESIIFLPKLTVSVHIFYGTIIRIYIMYSGTKCTVIIHTIIKFLLDNIVVRIPLHVVLAEMFRWVVIRFEWLSYGKNKTSMMMKKRNFKLSQ